MSCGIDCIKWFLFVFNFLWVLLGATILAVGIYLIVAVEDAGDLQVPVQSIGIIFIILGVIVFIIAFFGCCGAVKESHCMVVTYAVFLLVILIIQVALGIWAFVIEQNPTVTDNKEDMAKFKEGFNNAFDNYWTSREAQTIIEFSQLGRACCGMTGPADYERFTNKTLPESCCQFKLGGGNGVCTLSKAHKVGCTDDRFERVARIGGGVALGVAAAELVGIISALCLANSIRNDHRRGYRV